MCSLFVNSSRRNSLGVEYSLKIDIRLNTSVSDTDTSGVPFVWVASLHPEVSTPNSPLFLQVDTNRIAFRNRLTGEVSVLLGTWAIHKRGTDTRCF